MAVPIRLMAPGDAPEIERLYRQSAAHLTALGAGGPFDFSAAVFRRDAFGPSPAFSGIVAEAETGLAGYLLYTSGYDTDAATRTLFVIDLLVDEARRREGIGRALMERAAALCREAGGRALFWIVHEPNRPALDFYRALGARETPDLRTMAMDVGPPGRPPG